MSGLIVENDPCEFEKREPISGPWGQSEGASGGCAYTMWFCHRLLLPRFHSHHLRRQQQDRLPLHPVRPRIHQHHLRVPLGFGVAVASHQTSETVPCFETQKCAEGVSDGPRVGADEKDPAGDPQADLTQVRRVELRTSSAERGRVDKASEAHAVKGRKSIERRWNHTFVHN